MKKFKISNKFGTLEFSKIVMGTGFFGTSVKEETAFELLDYYYSKGGNCLDSARVYGAWVENGFGLSEKVIGRWIKSRNLRDKIYISTKGGTLDLLNPKQGRLSKAELTSDLNESLKDLQTDYIDIYFLHRDNTEIPTGEIIETLNGFIKEGKIRHFGCSNWTVGRIEQANKYASEHELAGFSVSQIQYSLASTTGADVGDKTMIFMDEENFGWYYKTRMPLMCFGSQSNGFFTKAVQLGIDNIKDRYHYLIKHDVNLKRLERLIKFCEEKKVSPTMAVLGFVNSPLLNSSSIIGCQKIEHLKDSLQAPDYELSVSEAEKLYFG